MTHDEEACRKRIAQLEEENDHLRRSAAQFGQLAERLNAELREERRAGRERRQTPRAGADRRRDRLERHSPAAKK